MNLQVAYSTDNNYVRHLAVSMVSLFENNKDFENINVHILDYQISEENKNNLLQIGHEYGHDINFYSVDVLLQDLLSKYQIPNTISISAYGRLFLQEILDNSINEILYIDCDSIILGSFKELINRKFENNSIYGVLDHVRPLNKVLIDLDEKSNYINSGFLYINLEKWRIDNVGETMIQYLASKNGNVSHHDQGLINACFNKEIEILPPNYNVMTSFFDFKNVEEIKRFYNVESYYSKEEILEARKNPILLHLTPGFSKRPWIKGCRHPLKHKYFEYLNKTPWKGTKVEIDKRNVYLKVLDYLFWTLGAKGYKIVTSIF